MPKANSTRQQANHQNHLETKWHQVDNIGIQQTQEETSPSSSKADEHMSVSENDQNDLQSQDMQMRGNSAEASFVSKQQTAALDLHQGCEEIEKLPRVLDLGPEHGDCRLWTYLT